MTPTESKKRLLEALKENHIIYAACRKAGISKSSYYRLRKDDAKFALAADEAIQEGVALVNDAAEGTVVGAIKERNLDAAKFWLKHRHPDFKDNIIQAGISMEEDGDGDTILQVFAQLKPKTRDMLKPYLKSNRKPNNHA
jgi:hypothetical protein